MTDAPFISTFIAVGLIPVAFFYVHAFQSGRKQLSFHKTSGSLAILWDVSMSLGYMMYRIFGGEVEGASLEATGLMRLYYIIHGIFGLLIVVFELIMLVIGILAYQRKLENKWHNQLSLPLFIAWWIAFLSGEISYILHYVL
ncbi:MAG: hypothetical protein ACFFCQ_14005 [Promethearchaeota archaeon]